MRKRVILRFYFRGKKDKEKIYLKLGVKDQRLRDQIIPRIHRQVTWKVDIGRRDTRS